MPSEAKIPTQKSGKAAFGVPDSRPDAGDIDQVGGPTPV